MTLNTRGFVVRTPGRTANTGPILFRNLGSAHRSESWVEPTVLAGEAIPVAAAVVVAILVGLVVAAEAIPAAAVVAVAMAVVATVEGVVVEEVAEQPVAEVQVVAYLRGAGEQEPRASGGKRSFLQQGTQ